VNRRYYAAAANILRLAELETVLNALAQAGIEAIVLKGAALASAVYSNIAERPMGDVDLLIRRQQLVVAERCMIGLGYMLSETNKARIGPFQVYTTGERGYYRSLGQFNLVFELHWQLSSVEAYSRIDTESLWAERRPLQIGRVIGWQLSPRDALLHVCVHLATHAFSHPVACTDIKQVVALPDFSWEPFLERVAQFRVKRAVYYALLLASQRMGVLVPDSVLTVLSPPRWQDRLVRHLLHLQTVGSRGGGDHLVADYLLHLALSDGLLDALRVLLGLAFPGFAWLEDRYNLHGAIAPKLMAVVHPAVVLMQVMGSCGEKIQGAGAPRIAKGEKAI
jgi:hypothetical protein